MEFSVLIEALLLKVERSKETLGCGFLVLVHLGRTKSQERLETLPSKLALLVVLASFYLWLVAQVCRFALECTFAACHPPECSLWLASPC